ncbi:MAG: Na+/H+ antiporter subunit B [Hyphomicrobiales bacterium]
MNTLILRTIAPALTALMIIFSLFVLLRGHNEPGGGFIGGLIAASAMALFGISSGVQAVRRALYFHPVSLAGFGVLMAAASGIPSYINQVPFLSGIWWKVPLGNVDYFDLSTPMIFDIGVWFVVVGAITAIALTLEEAD